MLMINYQQFLPFAYDLLCSLNSTRHIIHCALCNLSSQGKSAEVRAQRTQLKRIEELGALLEEHLILDNRYTEHSTVGLAQQWDQLDQLG